jgi:hypothetical protein
MMLSVICVDTHFIAIFPFAKNITFTIFGMVYLLTHVNTVRWHCHDAGLEVVGVATYGV